LSKRTTSARKRQCRGRTRLRGWANHPPGSALDHSKRSSPSGSVTENDIAVGRDAMPSSANSAVSRG
jgi:hypothetical protein